MTRKHERSLPVVTTEATPEFAPGVDEPPSEIDRREMMKLLAAGAALAGASSLAGCMKKPEERIMPRVENPPELTPGVPVSYATSMVIDGFATGLVVETQEARPTKVEGNPDHPASLGATSALHQASVLQLYDPHRATGALLQGAPTDLSATLHDLARRERMAGLWFLLHPQSSPLIEEQMARVRARHPTARFAFYSPVDRREVYEGARRVFGRPLECQYRFAQADVVVLLDADPLCAMPGSVRWSRDFAQRRRMNAATDQPSRIYAAEPRPTPSGSLADHRLPVRASEVRALALALLSALEQRSASELPAEQRAWVDAAAADLGASRGRALVVVGERQPAEVHALGHLINQALGAFGTTIALTRPALIDPLGLSLGDLVSALRAGSVQTLVIAEVNPLYAGPADLGLAELLPRVPEVIYAGFAQDETSRRCQLFLPMTHYMESWGDARAYDGTISFVQPLIQPMYGGVSLLELLATFGGDPEANGHDLVLRRYQQGTSEQAHLTWLANLQRGFLPDTAFPPEQVTPGAGAREAAAAPALNPIIPMAHLRMVEVSFDVSTAVYDGRYATISWLQELPRPLTKITWGNAALVSPATARQLGIETDQIVKIDVHGAQIELPVYVDPGHVDGCVSIELGYGRWAAGSVADNVGANAYRLRSSRAPWFALGTLMPTRKRHTLARTQLFWDQDDRKIAMEATLAEYRADPDFTSERRGEVDTLLPEVFPDVPKWGMTIDTSICSGCSSCVIACQAENNVPVVGPSSVIRNREMHWLRIDTYRTKVAGQVNFIHQPMLCQHCETAPCEYVCPTYATQHSPDGLNEMIYNRCIGTRFCQNNCPYKIRRFNWFDFTEDTPSTLRLQFNPNVTVRARGVMEKCTYCVQRIRTAEIAARKDKREIKPGEVMTACQQACPTGAIQFGQLQHAETTNVQWRNQDRHYEVLHQLGTKPKTIYLAKIWNLNEELER